MTYIKLALIALCIQSCSFKNIGEHGPNTSIINYEVLPEEVKQAYKYEFKIVNNSPIKSPKTTINLESNLTSFRYLKSTSFVTKAGKTIYLIGRKRFYFLWNANRETPPLVLYKKNVYLLFTPTGKEKLNYYLGENHKSMKYLRVDLTKHLKY